MVVELLRTFFPEGFWKDDPVGAIHGLDGASPLWDPDVLFRIITVLPYRDLAVSLFLYYAVERGMGVQMDSIQVGVDFGKLIDVWMLLNM